MAHERRLHQLERATDASAQTAEAADARRRRVILGKLWGYRRLAAYLTARGAPIDGALIEYALRGTAARLLPAGDLDRYSQQEAERDCRVALARGEAELATDGGQRNAAHNAARLRRRFAADFDRGNRPWSRVVPAPIRAMIVAHCGPDFDALGLPPDEVESWLGLWSWDVPGPRNGGSA